jgi:hypothetical protein
VSFFVVFLCGFSENQQRLLNFHLAFVFLFAPTLSKIKTKVNFFALVLFVQILNFSLKIEKTRRRETPPFPSFYMFNISN